MTGCGAAARSLALLAMAVLPATAPAGCGRSAAQQPAGESAPASATTGPAAVAAPATGSPATGGASADACSLVTAAEVKAATGRNYGSGTATPGDLVRICRFTAGNDILLIEAYPAGGDDVFHKAINGAASIANGEVRTVTDVGDQAGYVARAQTLCAHRGTANVCVVGASENALTTLARKAMSRM
ncbi:hypothetical protein [Krasilnikovia sp. MM14-A1259]|uniref:hypothetical protein n=1 Tax=Krasilnikovia sp. MM14-A1259 TaxID=3373539 RepID=UPI003824292F